MTEEEFGNYFINNFNTELPKEVEPKFQQWLAEESKKKGRDISKDMYDYDIKGAFLDLLQGNIKEDERGHLTDKYKKPNHPTFSNQSIYNETESPFGGKFIGGEWIEDPSGKVYYTPSLEMLNTTHPLEFLMDYMKKAEPDSELRIPDGALNRNRNK